MLSRIIGSSMFAVLLFGIGCASNPEGLINAVTAYCEQRDVCEIEDEQECLDGLGDFVDDVEMAGRRCQDANIDYYNCAADQNCVDIAMEVPPNCEDEHDDVVDRCGL